MAVPKKRTSYSKTRHRRSHQALQVVHGTFCAHCGKEKLSHRVCLACGYYRGKQILKIKSKKIDS